MLEQLHSCMHLNKFRSQRVKMEPGGVDVMSTFSHITFSVFHKQGGIATGYFFKVMNEM